MVYFDIFHSYFLGGLDLSVAVNASIPKGRYKGNIDPWSVFTFSSVFSLGGLDYISHRQCQYTKRRFSGSSDPWTAFIFT